jgi:hypothetical protein
LEDEEIMEDKQIIYNCPHISLTDWGTYACKLYNPRDKNCLVKGGNCVSNISCPYKQHKRKEQECEGLRMKNKILETECNEMRDVCNEFEQYYESLIEAHKKLKQTLTEIKPILEYYANSTIGEEQEDGTYHIELSYKYGSSNMYGAPCYYKYNPKPARQALQKISECEANK